MLFLFYRVVEHLLGSDADPLVHDNEGYNAVHHAAHNGHKLSVKMVSKKLLHHIIYIP